jgi:hypothetical protein
MTMKLTDPQFEILAAAAARGDNELVRGEHADERTLRSLAARHIGTLRYERVGARKVVTSLYVTFNGWMVYTEEARRRDQAAEVERNARPQTVPARREVDPFVVHTQCAQALREAAIDAAFAI